ncbi:radical SAM protein [Natronospora cellulosivora (SeqCode)]
MLAYNINDKCWYLPLKKLIVKTSKRINNKEFANSISNKWLKQFKDSTIREIPDADTNFKNIYPYCIGLIPTNECNLRCLYCYSNAGEHMKIELSKIKIDNVINLLIRNAIIHKRIRNKDIVSELTISGGGEPTYNWDKFKYIVDTFKYKCKKYNINNKIILVTNGMKGKRKIDYILENIDQINLSFDGPKKIQNIQRPSRNNKGSFKMVDEFIKTCEEKGKEISTRSTILPENFNNLVNICDFIFEKYSNVNIAHIEPLFLVGRGENFKETPLDKMLEFMVSYIDTYNYINKKYSGKILYNSTFIYNVQEYYCSASLGLKPWVHMDGSIIPCTDYITKDNLKIGYVKDSGINYNSNYTGMSLCLKKCKNCFAYYQCGGGCVHNIVKDINGDCASAYSQAYCNMIKKFWEKAILAMSQGKSFCGMKPEPIDVNGEKGLKSAYLIK